MKCAYPNCIRNAAYSFVWRGETKYTCSPHMQNALEFAAWLEESVTFTPCEKEPENVD